MPAKGPDLALQKLIQTQLPTQRRQILSQGIHRANQRFAVVFLDLVVGFKPAICGFVFRQNLVHRRKVLVDFGDERRVLLLDLWMEQVDDFLRAVDVALEVIRSVWL